MKAVGKSLFKSFDKSVEALLAVFLIVFLISGVIVFLVSRVGNSTNTEELNLNQNFEGLNDETVFSQLIEVSDPKSISVGNNIIRLQDPWFVTSILKDFTKNSDYGCQDVTSADCIAFFVTDSQQNYYFSTPSAFRSKTTISTVPEERILVISGREIQFVYERVELVTRVEESGENRSVSGLAIYKEIFGCPFENLCVSSGLLNVDDQETNSSQVRSFELFLNSIII